ncbi:MAG TPA: 4-(cytidine 5'-diphospho)-2-C-methyl-D-erythritol kinase [Acidobacteriaceae bacterium]|jgi:4-diphosphocytidyl-2-C-methyl-D-erythritol kinase|nr:4-(cytidine 5'-diphospho)-2-C-methyl-D-erythritol kinase [Acidobacteriaceae bacterium]
MPTHVRSHAKINLGLAIGPTRPDGFHALTTIYQTLALYDVVTVAAERLPDGVSTTIQMACTDAQVPCDARNTCWKMVELVLAAMKISARVSLHIDKKLPVQGGLGAGSANAVAALIGLERELQQALPDPARLAIAAQVGSDVPLFLIGGTILGTGRGEQVSPLPDLPELPCVVATPPIGVSTPQAFRDWDALQSASKALTSAAASDRLKELGHLWAAALAGSHQEVMTVSGVFLRVVGPEKDRAEEVLLRLVRAGIENDFECVVFPLYPSLHGILQTLRTSSSGKPCALYAALSGSGSALFGLYTQETEAHAVGEQLAALGIPALQTKTLCRAEYWRNMVDVEG